MDKAKQAQIGRELQKLAWDYEKDFGGCSQAVVGAFKKALGGIGDDVFKASTGLAGGVGLTGNTCGALLGGVVVLSSFLGRDYDNFADPEGSRFDSFKLAKELVERFEAEYGSPKCEHIQTKILGRYYDIWTEREAFLAAGGHAEKCPSVCANAAKWVYEILTKNNLI